MAVSSNQNAQKYGSFVPTTNIWDVSQLYSIDVNSPEFKELLVRLYQNVNNIALSVNTRDSGFYDTGEFINGQVWFSNPALTSSTSTLPTQRQDYRLVVIFGALPNTATKSVPHGLQINTGWSSTRVYGAATNPTAGAFSWLPIPYSSSSAVANNIELNVDGTNVNITTGANYSAYTICYVVLEYLKQ